MYKIPFCHEFNQVVTILNLFSSADESLNKIFNLKDFWKLETTGVRESLDLTDDDKVYTLEQFDKSLSFKDGRYHIQ